MRRRLLVSVTGLALLIGLAACQSAGSRTNQQQQPPLPPSVSITPTPTPTVTQSPPMQQP